MTTQSDDDRFEPEQNHPGGGTLKEKNSSSEDTSTQCDAQAVSATGRVSAADHKGVSVNKGGRTGNGGDTGLPKKPATGTSGGDLGRAPTVRERQAMMHLASAGFELASFSLILGGAGYAVDHWLGNATPYFAIAGLLIGFSLGFYRLIVLASKMG
ncbi:AtpZ/AtpI family protein [Rhodopirellula sallentina]|uniref:Putative membrane protein n=1 Tax=Rhodopirellula sallentina SM41 TaxID=1263870 RepID=M5U3Q8_9BACT|nr:AtpZ/AtpI family protein [Rhodopirellula sallentina]EMI52501.1 putative membrane protein [Rhodopirellula sallentina SM41]